MTRIMTSAGYHLTSMGTLVGPARDSTVEGGVGASTVVGTVGGTGRTVGGTGRDQSFIPGSVVAGGEAEAEAVRAVLKVFTQREKSARAAESALADRDVVIKDRDAALSALQKKVSIVTRARESDIRKTRQDAAKDAEAALSARDSTIAELEKKLGRFQSAQGSSQGGGRTGTGLPRPTSTGRGMVRPGQHQGSMQGNTAGRSTASTSAPTAVSGVSDKASDNAV